MSRVVLLVSGCVFAAAALYFVALTAADDSVSQPNPWADVAAAGTVGLIVLATIVAVLGRRRNR